jgi:quercetin dioxygenase-like cupin family protein
MGGGVAKIMSGLAVKTRRNLQRRKQKNYMNKSLIALGVAAAVVIAGAMGAAGSEKKSANKKKEVIYVSSEQATYKEAMPGVSMAVLWGDPEKGAHGTFTKFAPGYDAGTHTHTNDVWLVVIKGAYLYKDDAGEKRVGPGEFIWIPGGHKHWSGGDKTEGALFYQGGSGKFDLIPAK